MDTERERIWLGLRLSGDQNQFELELQDVNARVGGLKQRQAEIEARLESARQAQVTAEGLEQSIKTVRANLADLSFESKRKALEALNIEVVLYEGKIIINGAIPVSHGVVSSASIG